MSINEKKAPAVQPAEHETYGLPPVLTVDEVAAFLRLNRKTVFAAIAAKEMPGRRVGRRVVVLRDALLDWMRSKARLSSRKRRA